MESGSATGRTSSRVRTKSQRAVESEHTDRLIARAKERAQAERQGSAQTSEHHGSVSGAGLSATAEDDVGDGGSGVRDGDAEVGAEGKGSGAGGGIRKKGRASTAPDAAAGKTKPKGRPKKVYCVCKTADSGAMIECEGCNDWYVSLKPPSI